MFLGAFSHSANYYVVYPGDTPENHPPTKGCMINSKQHGVQIKTLGPVASIRLKKNILGVPAGSVGCRIQDPRICGYQWWKTTNFSHGAGTLQGAPPLYRWNVDMIGELHLFFAENDV